jgi:hypothetical protein
MLKEKQDLKKGLKVIQFYFNNLFFDTNCKNCGVYDFAVLKLEPNSIIEKDQILKFSFNFILSESIDKEIMACGYSS